MNSYLCIHILPGNDQNEEKWHVRAALFDGAFRPVAEYSGTDLTEAKERLLSDDTNLKTIVFVAAETTTLVSAAIPPSTALDTQKALPYLLEEFLADDIHDLHIAPGPILEGRIHAAVITHRSRDYWIDFLQKFQISADHLTSEIFLVPFKKTGDWGILIDDKRMLLRTGTYEGLFTDLSSMETVLGLALGEARKTYHQPPSITAYHMTAGNQNIATLQAICAKNGTALEIRKLSQPHELLQYYLASGATQNSISLMPKESQGNKQFLAFFFRWRAVFGILVLWMFLQLGLDVSKALYYQARAADFEDQAIAIYKKLFPQDTKIINPQAQMEAFLKNYKGSSQPDSFFRLLQKTAAKAPSGENANTLTLQHLLFNAQTRQLTIHIEAKAPEPLNHFADALRDSGLNVEEKPTSSGTNLNQSTLLIGETL